jgi:hypothetical protein
VPPPSKASTRLVHANLTEQFGLKTELRTGHGQQLLGLGHNRGAHAENIRKGGVKGRGTRDLKDALADAQDLSRPGPKPETGNLAIATLPEWYVYWALTQRLHKREGIDFAFRGSVAYAAGLAASTSLDFSMLDGSQIAIEVQGLFWHYQQGAAKMTQDYVRQGALAGLGMWRVVNIDEDDALRDPEFYVREALQGRDHSYRYRGYFVNPAGTTGGQP